MHIVVTVLYSSGTGHFAQIPRHVLMVNHIITIFLLALRTYWRTGLVGVRKLDLATNKRYSSYCTLSRVRSTE
jgi:hypothetical protein